MPQSGTNVTIGPLRIKASLVWICSGLASTQKAIKARPTMSSGMGLSCGGDNGAMLAVGAGETFPLPSNEAPSWVR